MVYEGREFESTSSLRRDICLSPRPGFLWDVGLSLQLCFGGVVGLSPHLFWGGCGFESTSLFLEIGGVF